MARTTINRTTLSRNSSVSAAAAGVYQAADATNGMQINADILDRVLLHVKNTNAAARTVTIKAGTAGHLGMAWMGVQGDMTVNIPANTGDVLIGPLESARFKQNDGMVYVDIDADTNVTIAAFRLPKD